MQRRLRGRASMLSPGTPAKSCIGARCAIFSALEALSRRSRYCGLGPLERVTLGEPKIAVIDVLPILEPRAAAGEMHGLGRAGRELIVPALEEIPGVGNFADLIVGRPLHAM